MRGGCHTATGPSTGGRSRWRTGDRVRIRAIPNRVETSPSGGVFYFWEPISAVLRCSIRGFRAFLRCGGGRDQPSMLLCGVTGIPSDGEAYRGFAGVSGLGFTFVRGAWDTLRTANLLESFRKPVVVQLSEESESLLSPVGFCFVYFSAFLPGPLHHSPFPQNQCLHFLRTIG